MVTMATGRVSPELVAAGRHVRIEQAGKQAGVPSCSADFFKIIYMNTIRVLNGWNPNQDRHSAGQWSKLFAKVISADDKSHR